MEKRRLSFPGATSLERRQEWKTGEAVKRLAGQGGQASNLDWARLCVDVQVPGKDPLAPTPPRFWSAG